MLQISLWKRVLIIGLCLLGLAMAAPNLFYNRVEGHNDALAAFEKTGAMTAAQEEARAGWPDWLPSGLVNLGLDLRGGAHLLAEVKVAEVYKARMDALWPEMRKALAAAGSDVAVENRLSSGLGRLLDRRVAKLPHLVRQDVDHAVRGVHARARAHVGLQLRDDDQHVVRQVAGRDVR